MKPLWILTGGLAVVVGLFIYSRTQRGQTAIASTLDTSPLVLQPSDALFQNVSDFFSYVGNAVKNAAGSILPEGIRNNNPGNMKYDPAIHWQGQTGQDAHGFIIFDTMLNGVRAMTKELYNYSALHGLNTVRDIITRWSTTDQSAYVQNVANALGVDPDTDIDVNDSGTMTALVRAIANQENGTAVATATLSDGTIAQGVQEGLA